MTLTPSPTATTTETPTPTATSMPGVIEGLILLQGRTFMSGTTITAYQGGVPILETLTDADGNFALELPSGTYDLGVERALYLDTQKTGVLVNENSTTTLPAITLPGGDATENDKIDILDLVLIGSAYGTSEGDPHWNWRADINGDGIINIQDLTMTAGNYQKQSLIPW